MARVSTVGMCECWFVGSKSDIGRWPDGRYAKRLPQYSAAAPVDTTCRQHAASEKVCDTRLGPQLQPFATLGVGRLDRPR